MNEYIQTEVRKPVMRKKGAGLCGKMLITFMVIDIALTVLMNLFAPKALVAAVCPTISFIVTFFGLFRRECGRLNKRDTDKRRRSVGMSAAADYMFAVLAATVCLGVIAAVFDLTGIDIFSDSIRVKVPLGGFSGGVYVVYLCLVAPFIHEFMFRGVVMKSMEEYGENTAVLVSALLYGLLHGVYITSIYAFAAGIVLAKASLKAKSTVVKINILCSLLIYAIIFTVWKDWIFVYIPLFAIFGFFAFMGMLRALLKKLDRKKKQSEPADFKVLLTLPIAGAALLMIAEDLLFLFAK